MVASSTKRRVREREGRMLRIHCPLPNDEDRAWQHGLPPGTFMISRFTIGREK